MKKPFLLIVVLALAVAACGGADDATTDELPVNDGDTAAVDSSTCLEGEPDCQDIPGNEGPQDLPTDGDAVDSGGMTVDGGLTIAEALATDASGVIAVKGYIVATGEGVRLCDVLLESYPPQCGGDSLVLDSLDTIDPDELKSEGEVSWTDVQQTVLGELSEGVLNTTSLSM